MKMDRTHQNLSCSKAHKNKCLYNRNLINILNLHFK